MSKIYTKSHVIPGIIDDIDILSIIRSPRLVRDDLEGVDDLASSIKQNGFFSQSLSEENKNTFMKLLLEIGGTKLVNFWAGGGLPVI